MTELVVHANAVLVGEGAVLVRGASGSGKTRLSLGLIDAARTVGVFARLIGDDRIRLVRCHGRLLARPIESIAGMVERRGLGLTPLAHETAGCVRLVIDLVPGAVPRMPEPDMLVTEISGVTLPRLSFQSNQADPAQTLVALALFNDEPWMR
jgi:serine kinase of HPr protein (carbohydrate metabolism regulator)